MALYSTDDGCTCGFCQFRRDFSLEEFFDMTVTDEYKAKVASTIGGLTIDKVPACVAGVAIDLIPVIYELEARMTYGIAEGDDPLKNVPPQLLSYITTVVPSLFCMLAATNLLDLDAGRKLYEINEAFNRATNSGSDLIQ